jgi:ABC-type transporter Mla subunit MlaD
LEFSLPDLSTQTVRATLAEITAATFDADERTDLKTLLKVFPDANPPLPNDVLGLNTRNALFAVMVAFRGEVPPREQRTVVLAPDPEPPSDLASWRALAHLPLDLPPFPALVPENPIR